MSFILDALRKSEHARQSLGTAALAELPLGRRARTQPWWIAGIAALLLINLVVLAVVLLRDAPAKTQSAIAQTSAPNTASPPPVATADNSRPLSEEASPPQVRYETVERSETPLADPLRDGPALVKRIDPTPPGTASGSVTTTTTLNGLPELRIDMHVYAKIPAERFVFINMHKYLEGQTLAEGPRLDEITPDGVLLDYKGQQLRLQRP